MGTLAQAQTADTLTLDQAIQQVMKNHPLIDQAGQQVKASEARVGESRSLYYPQIDAGGSYAYIGPVPTLSIPDMGSFSLYPNNNYDIHVGVRQTVFDFGRRSVESDLARARQRLAEDNSERVRSTLAYQTVRTFYIILYLQENIRTLDEEIISLNAHQSIAEKKKQTGSATDFDVLTIRVRVANARSEQVDVESALEKQTIALKRLLGIPVDQEISLKGDFNPTVGGIDLDSLFTLAYRQRPEMIIARDTETSFDIQAHLATLGNKPSMTANVSLGLKNGYIPDLNKPTVNWIAGVGLQMPLFDGFRTHYKTEASKAGLEAARAHSRDVEEQIRSEVRQALADIRARQEKIRTSELQLEQADQALALAKTQYEIGVITNLDLLVAQTSRYEANLQHIRALYEMILSRFALRQTIGDRIW
jgi:outer membrane protein TolC